MSGFYTEGEIGNSLQEAQGIDAIPTGAGEVLGATFGQAFAENPASRLARLIARNIEPYPITLSAEEATARYGVEGRLAFTEPVTVTQARDLYDFHSRSAVRENIIARRSGDLGTGGLARFGAGVAASIIDPLNVASAFIPFVGEARMASILGAAAARGAAGRFAVRGATGVIEGAAGAALLEPANLWLSSMDRDDYTMGDAMLNIAFGAVIGGTLRGGLGVVRDRRGLPVWAPETRQHAMQQAMSAVVEGRPVDAYSAMEFAAIREARAEIASWQRQAARIEAESDAALSRSLTRGEALAAARANLDRITADLDQVQREIGAARERLPFDQMTQERLQDIEAELAGVVPAARRADLLRERRLLREGAEATPDVEVARTEAEIAGLGAERGRLARSRGLAEARLRKAEAAAKQADRTLDVASKQLAAREALIGDLTQRTLAKVSGGLNAQIKSEDLIRLSNDIADAPAAERAAAIDRALAEIAAKAPAGPYRPTDLAAAPGSTLLNRVDAQLAERQAKAEEGLKASLRGTPDPRVQAADQVAAEAEAKAPKMDTLDDEVASLDALNAETEKAIKAIDDAEAAQAAAEGRKPAKADDPDVVEADEWRKEGQAMAKAYEAAAVCQISRRA